MKAEFYDVKAHQKVNVEVEYKKQTPTGRYMIYGKTADGRALPKFTNEADYNKKFAAVPVQSDKPAAKACAKKGCCKKK